MKDYIFQTVAKLFNLGYLCSVSEEAILHILQDVKIAHSTGLRWHLMRIRQLSKGATMLNENALRQKMALSQESKGQV